MRLGAPPFGRPQPFVLVPTGPASMIPALPPGVERPPLRRDGCGCRNAHVRPTKIRPAIQGKPLRRGKKEDGRRITATIALVPCSTKCYIVRSPRPAQEASPTSKPGFARLAPFTAQARSGRVCAGSAAVPKRPWDSRRRWDRARFAAAVAAFDASQVPQGKAFRSSLATGRNAAARRRKWGGDSSPSSR